MEGNYLNTIKAINENPTDSILLNGEKLKAFTLRSGTGKDIYSHYIIQHSTRNTTQSN